MKEPEHVDLSNEVTRRQWLLRLGEVAALAGVSGLVPEAATFLLSAQTEAAALPPGLYSPSADDLVHALSAHKLVVPPPGSETEYAQAASPFHSQFFSEEEFRVIARIASIMLGNVDSDALAQTTQWIDLWFLSSAKVRTAAQNLDPLHRALAVAYFGEESVRKLEAADPARTAREGMAALHKLSQEKYHRGFSDLAAGEQTELLSATETSDAEIALKQFITLVRNEAIRGYYTTAGGLKELDYKGNAYHPSCPGCDSLAEGPGSDHS